MIICQMTDQPLQWNVVLMVNLCLFERLKKILPTRAVQENIKKASRRFFMFDRTGKRILKLPKWASNNALNMMMQGFWPGNWGFCSGPEVGVR